MIQEDVQDFLKFQQKFTKRQWHELNAQVGAQYQKRADEIQLTDSDIEEVTKRLNLQQSE